MQYSKNLIQDFVIFSIVLISITPKAVASGIDSMLAVLKTEISSTERIKTHNRIAHYYLRSDTTKFIYHKDLVDSIANAENDTLGVFLANSLEIMHYTRLEKMGIVESKIRKSIQLAKLMKSPNFMTGSNYELARHKYSTNQIDSAIHYGNKAYDIGKTNEDLHPTNLILMMNFLGSCHFKNLDYDKALEIYYEADKITDTMTDRYQANSKGEVYQNISRIYLAIGDTSLSIQNLHKTIPLFSSIDNSKGLTATYQRLTKIYQKTKPDSSFHYIEKAYSSAKKLGRKSTVGSIINQMGDHWYEQDDYTLALKYYNESLEIFSTINNKQSIADTKMRIGRVQEKRKQFKLALQSIDVANTIYKDLNIVSSIQAAEQSRSDILSKLGRHKESRSALNIAMTLQDSVRQKKYNQTVNEIQTKYETEKKEAALEKQNLIISKQENEKKSLIYGGLGLFTLLGLFLWSIYSRLQKNKRIAAQEKEIQSQYIAELENEKKILSMSSMIEGQESERKRIAQDLHDGLGGLLSTIKIKFGIIQKEIAAIESMNIYQQTSTMIDNACSEVRKISHNMMPGALTKLGLVEAIEDMAIYTTDIKIEVINQGIHPLTETQEIMLYRVIQEFTNNTRKHAEANKILIQFSKNAKGTSILLQDDGKGFDYKIDSIENGLGLNGMKSRISFIGGSYIFDSKIGTGTTIKINIPT